MDSSGDDYVADVMNCSIQKFSLSVSSSVIGSDFNADGKPDLIWRNPATGENVCYYMDGVTILSGVYMPSVDPAWILAGK